MERAAKSPPIHPKTAVQKFRPLSPKAELGKALEFRFETFKVAQYVRRQRSPHTGGRVEDSQTGI